MNAPFPAVWVPSFVRRSCRRAWLQFDGWRVFLNGKRDVVLRPYRVTPRINPHVFRRVILRRILYQLTARRRGGGDGAPEAGGKLTGYWG